MRRTASEVLHELETRVARLERKAWNPFKKKEAPGAPVQENASGDYWSLDTPALSLGFESKIKEVQALGLDNTMEPGGDSIAVLVKKVLPKITDKQTVVDEDDDGLHMDILKKDLKAVYLLMRSSRQMVLVLLFDAIYDLTDPRSSSVVGEGEKGTVSLAFEYESEQLSRLGTSFLERNPGKYKDLVVRNEKDWRAKLALLWSK